MEEWLIYSFLSCIGFSIWSIAAKKASLTVDASTYNLIQLPIRIIVTIFTVLQRQDATIPSIKTMLHTSSLHTIMEAIGKIHVHGFIYTVIAGVSSVLASFSYSDALEKGGSGSAVAVLTGSYPALSYVMSVVAGWEEIKMTKVIGVALAIGSCYCFAA